MHTKSNKFALVTLTALFFAMGFITVLNDVLIPHLKAIFDLNYFQASLVQFCFFGAYFITGSLFGKLLSKVGYPWGVILGFLLSAIGCILFYPAASTGIYSIFLCALFILASGVVLLQTAGNPFVTLLSPGKEASSLTLVQAFNSLGTTLGPLFGATFILSASEFASKQAEAQSVQIPYLCIAGVLIILAVVVYLLKLPDVREVAEAVSQANHDGKTSLFQYHHLVLGALGIFCYVGAEVSIGSFLISTMYETAGIIESTGAKYIAFYWGGAMVGRFVGSAVMTRIAPNKYLAFNCAVNICLILIAILSDGGNLSMVALLACGFFNSIMFPTIFSLATKNLGKFTSAASGFICVAIVGGALVPPVQGLLADSAGLILSYIVPMVCYFYILFFALKGYRIK